MNDRQDRGFWEQFADGIKGQQPVEPEIVEPAPVDPIPEPAVPEPAGRTVEYRVHDYIIAHNSPASMQKTLQTLGDQGFAMVTAFPILGGEQVRAIYQREKN